MVQSTALISVLYLETFFQLEEILLYLSLFNAFMSLKEIGQWFWKCKGWRRETGIEGGHVLCASLGNQAQNEQGGLYLHRV